MNVDLHLGDCIAYMRTLESESVHAVVTDPPYHLTSIVKRFGKNGSKAAKHGTDGAFSRSSKGFMGKEWDGGDIAFRPEVWIECLRVLKPGGYLLAFGGTRTYHRLACAIEDAGFEIRDQICWTFGSGFPKSHDISKAIDKRLGSKRRIVGYSKGRSASVFGGGQSVGVYDPVTVAATDDAKQWDGWGTALKPSHEIIAVAIKLFPYNVERDIISENLSQLEARLWSLLTVNIAVSHFQLSPAEYDAACASAHWSAEQQNSLRDDLFAPMDTSQFVKVIKSCLSIVRSWRITWDALCSLLSTFTIETESSLTTDLKTLNCLLSQITPADILKSGMQADGLTLPVLYVEQCLAAVLSKWQGIHTLSVAESAISQAQVKSLDGIAKTFQNHILMARKPITGNVADNVLRHGTGALNIDASRIETNGEDVPINKLEQWSGFGEKDNPDYIQEINDKGRWPANLIHDGSLSVMRSLPEGADRFFKACPFDESDFDPIIYRAKPDKEERDGSTHPTMKPVSLMQYLVNMVTVSGATVLDPFLGSGTTGVACAKLGRNFIGCDIESEYIEIARRRIEEAQKQMVLL